MKRKDILNLLNAKSIRINETNPTIDELYDDKLIVYGAKIKNKSLIKSFDPLKPFYGFVISDGVKMTSEELTKSKFLLPLMNYYTLSGQPSKIEETMLYYVKVPILSNRDGAALNPEDYTDQFEFDAAIKTNIPCIVSPLELSSYVIPEKGRMVKIRFTDQNMDSAMIIGVMNAPVILAKTLQPYISDFLGGTGGFSQGGAYANVGGYNRDMPIGNVVCNNGTVFNQNDSERSKARTKFREIGPLKKNEYQALWTQTVQQLGTYIRLGESSGGRLPSDADYDRVNGGNSGTPITQLTARQVSQRFRTASGAWQNMPSFIGGRVKSLQSTCPDDNYTMESLYDKKMQDDMFANMILNQVVGVGGYIRGADMDLSQAIIELGATWMAVGMPFNGKYYQSGRVVMNLYKNDCYNPDRYSARRQSVRSNNRATLDPTEAARILKNLRSIYLNIKGETPPVDRETVSTVDSCI